MDVVVPSTRPVQTQRVVARHAALSSRDWKNGGLGDHEHSDLEGITSNSESDPGKPEASQLMVNYCKLLQRCPV